jgi:hypothetical protein
MEKHSKKDSPKLWQAWKQIKARNWSKPSTVLSFLLMPYLGTCSKVTYKRYLTEAYRKDTVVPRIKNYGNIRQLYTTWRPKYNLLFPAILFFFFFLGPFRINAPVCTAAFKAYCATLNIMFSPYSTALCLLCRGRVPNCDCTYVCWFNNQIPEDVITLASQCLAAADNMLYCFDLLPAESTGRIPFKQTYGT